MAITAAPQQLTKGLKADFLESLENSSDSLIDRIATYVNSNSDKEDYAWLGEVSQMVAWDDEVQFNALSETAAAFEAINLKYAMGLQIKRDDLADEKTGGLKMRVQDLAVRAAMYPDVQLIAVLAAGTSVTCYDGSVLFTATHAARGDSGIQSNLLTQSGTSTAQVAADINDGVAALYNMLDESGEPMNRPYRKFFVHYPPALNKSVMEAVGAPVVAQTSNVQFSRLNFDLIMDPLLTAVSSSDFYIGIQDAPVRGLLYQSREPVSFESLEDGDEAFKKEILSYKVRQRSVAKPARWQRIVKVA